MTEVATTGVPVARGGNAALRVMQIGALAVVVAVSTYFTFELDRFFVPKELVLHVTAVLAALFSVRAIGQVIGTRVDALLIAFFLLGVISALLATNHWLALRSLAVTSSGLLLFWTARTLRLHGRERPLLVVLAMAVVLVAVTSLLQTYGVETQLFSENRAPGGTLGNRNFVAHAGAFGLPLLMLAAIGARNTRSFLAGAIGIGMVTGVLALTRSRAAWLAFGAVVVVFLIALFMSRALRTDGRTWRRVATIALLCAAGVAAVLLIPNTLQWRSDNPYLESIERIADYEGGSGRGRLIQYERSLVMTARNPLFGVGPGNWPVEYPRHAARRDPSVNQSEGGMTFNPWPSSDWVGWMAERGFAAVLLLGIAFASIAVHAIRQLLRATDAGEGLIAAALLATIAAAGIAGAFDAVLLIALPALLVWSALGALWVPLQIPAQSRWRLIVPVVILISAAGVIRSTAQLVAMGIFEVRDDRASMVTAARIDPGNYRLRLRLARMSRGDARCRHALAARSLFPHADAAMELARRCDD